FIIATTGQSRPEDFQRSREAGCDVHLVKPLDLAQIVALIENWKARGGGHSKALAAIIRDRPTDRAHVHRRVCRVRFWARAVRLPSYFDPRRLESAVAPLVQRF